MWKIIHKSLNEHIIVLMNYPPGPKACMTPKMSLFSVANIVKSKQLKVIIEKCACNLSAGEAKTGRTLGHEDWTIG